MLINLDLKKVYDSETCNLVRDFYIPALENSVKYKRITGYFSAGSLVLASEGIFKLIQSGGNYELIMGNTLDPNDFLALSKGVKQAKDFLDLDLSLMSKSELFNNRFKLLSWMIANNSLKIKIVFLKNNHNGIFHEKIGIFEDIEGNVLSFSGSINETASGWDSNVEEFKVFKGWLPEEKDYLINDLNKFDRYWNGITDSFIVLDLPTAMEEKLLTIKPSERELNKIIDKEIENLPKFSTLYDYQKEAVLSWKKNNFKGIFEMATGTGKTITALASARLVADKNLITVIIVPQTHLIRQWEKDIKNEIPNASIYKIYGDNSEWKKDLYRILSNFGDGFSKKNNVILTTYSTLSSEYFLSTFESLYNPKKKYLAIADEMHNFGSGVHRKGMLEIFDYRLGLSATPSRWFDDEGSLLSERYFDKVVFTYDLKKAIENGFLTKYLYFPHFVNLTSDEYAEYKRLTFKLLNLFNNSSDPSEKSTYLERILIRRSKILKKCENKFIVFESIIKQLISENMLDHLLVYCDSTEQLQSAQQILNDNKIISHTFTQEETDEERESLLMKFDNGTFDCLLAMKCLDEGVDVPSTKTAIILASSTNPREYIQRRGRVLRRHKNKKISIIYDFIVEPPMEDRGTIYKIDQKILHKELTRVADFLETAENQSEILTTLSPKMLKYGVYI